MALVGFYNMKKRVIKTPWCGVRKNRTSPYCRCRKGISKPMVIMPDFCAICFKLLRKYKKTL